MKTKKNYESLDAADSQRLAKALSELFLLGLAEDGVKALAVDLIEHFFEELRIERTPYSAKLAYVASMLRTEPDLVRALFPNERVEEAYRRDQLKKALQDGDASGVFKGDATASVIGELGLDKIPAPPATSPHFTEV